MTILKATRFKKIKFTKTYDTLFWNHIKDLEYKEIPFTVSPAFNDEDSITYKAYRVKLTKKEYEKIKAYANTLKIVKETSSFYIDGKTTSYKDKEKHYLQGFVAEYAFIKLCLHLGLKVSWYDALCAHKKGDNGDATIGATSIDVKSKDYNCPDHDLHYDVTKLGKSKYFVFTHLKYQDDDSVHIDILGYHEKDYIKSIPVEKQWAGQGPYWSRRVSYKTLKPIEDFFTLSF